MCRLYRALALVLIVCAANAYPSSTHSHTAVAFMPDIHFHDVYGDFPDSSFEGIKNSATGKHATIRSMAAQLHSTRLFNENYFALLAALDDAVDRGIRLIGLPGDFSDDGQPIHLAGLKQILTHYRDEYGVQFFATPGNHDPVRPIARPGGEPDFLNPAGREVAVQSPQTEACQTRPPEAADGDDNLFCATGIRQLGYPGVVKQMGFAGFMPQEHYLHWETPFSDFGKNGYQFESALAQSSLEQRQFTPQQSQCELTQRRCDPTFDTSYLVEPVKGLWLLALDANIYAPQGQGYRGSGNAGYNALVESRPYLIEWIRDIRRRAEQQGKHLMAFSHYPMVDFYDEQSRRISELFGPQALQLIREPEHGTSELLAGTGVGLHVSGHMHMNDTGVYKTPDGQPLVNIQTPSLAAYPGAYKIITLRNQQSAEVETVWLDKVPRFDELFPHYRREHQYLAEHAPERVWDKRILQADDYRAFTRWHLKELVRLRFVPDEWPQRLRQLLPLDGWQWLVLAHYLPREPSDSTIGQGADWRKAQERAYQWLQSRDATDLKNTLAQWQGMELAVDFYRLRNGGELALTDIGAGRLSQYRLIADAFARDADQARPGRSREAAARLMRIMRGFMTAQPDDHFRINLHTGAVTDLTD